ncbi:unnamed protein product, partial [Tuber aestivum]
MSVNTNPTDAKVAPVASDPPSYTDATSSNSAPVYGDGNVFTDQPTMSYTATTPEPYTPRKKGWMTGIFDCFVDPASGTKALCCPCVSYAQTRHRLHAPNTPAPVLSTPCLGYCLVMSCFPGAEFIFGFMQRGDIRNRLNIDHSLPKGTVSPASASREPGKMRMFESMDSAGGCIDDFWRHFFCAPCSLAQEDREVSRWEREVAGGEGWCDDDEELGGFRGVETTRGEEGISEEGERLLGFPFFHVYFTFLLSLLGIIIGQGGSVRWFGRIG